MNSHLDHGSHLFLVRFWKEEAQGSQGHKGWSGRVQHVLSGEAHTFEGWPKLIDLLLEMSETELIEGAAPVTPEVPESTKKEALP